MNKNEHFVLGADFGSDSVRVVVLDAADGSVQGSDVRLSAGKRACTATRKKTVSASIRSII